MTTYSKKKTWMLLLLCLLLLCLLLLCLLLLPLALQPAVGFGLSNNTSPFFLSIASSLHLLTPSTWRSLSTSSLTPFLGLPLRPVPSISRVKIFLGILSSSILSSWPSQIILCPFIHFTILYSNFLVLDLFYFSILHLHI